MVNTTSNDPASKASIPTTLGLNITELPVDVIFTIFFDVAQNNIKEASLFPRSCKKWQKQAHETPLYRLFILQKYPQIDLKNLGADDFQRAFIFSNRMTRMAKAYSQANLNLLTYNAYKKQLSYLLNEHSDFLTITPYFDLRPFAWLDHKSWQECFNHFAPLLKKVQVLELRGIGKEIYPEKVNLPSIPVLTKTANVTKFIVKEFIEHSGVNTQTKNVQKTKETLIFCICAIGKISMNLTTINCSHTTLTYKEINWIKQHFPNITLMDT